MRTQRLPGIVAAAVSLLLAAAWGLAPYREVDTWWHLRVGAQVLETGRLSWTDPSATMAARPYLATQWLPEVVATWSVQHWGMGAVLWLRALATVSLAVAVYVTARHRAGRLPSGMAASLTLLASGAGLNPRPQLVSFVLFAVVVLACLRTIEDGRPRWWLVPVFWLWGCSHGLWSVGLAVMAVLLTGAVLDPHGQLHQRTVATRLAALWLACAVVVACTPLGPRLLLTPFTVAGTASGLAEEWQPTPVNNPFSVAAVAMVAITAVLWLVAGRRPRLWQALGLLMSLGLTLVMWRLVPLGAILAAPLLAQALQRQLGDGREPWGPTERRAVVGAVVAALIVAASVAAGPAGASAQRFPGDLHRVDAALSDLPAGTVVLDDFALSGWLLWMHPELTPVMDLRAEIYGREHIEGYRTMEGVRPGWRELVDTSRATYAVQNRDSSLADALQHRAGWRVVVQEGDFVLLAREGR